MNRKILGGVVLVVLGAAGMAVRDIPYTTKEALVNLGGVRVSGDVQKYSPVPLIAGGAWWWQA